MTLCIHSVHYYKSHKSTGRSIASHRLLLNCRIPSFRNELLRLFGLRRHSGSSSTQYTVTPQAIVATSAISSGRHTLLNETTSRALIRNEL